MNDLEICLMDERAFPAYLESTSSDNIRADILGLMATNSKAVAVAKPKKATKAGFDRHFDQFWSSGIRKSNKKKARLAFHRILPDFTDHADVFTAMLCRDISARIQADQLGFTEMHPTTYLNGERWEDEIKPREDPSPKTGMGEEARKLFGLEPTEEQQGFVFEQIAPPINDDMAFLEQTRARTLEHKA